MGRIFLDEATLSKDIEYIRFYSKEEEQCLQQICSKLKEGLENYKSSNGTLLESNITKFESKTFDITNKRYKYTSTLEEVITRYNKLNKKAVDLLEENYLNGDFDV